MKIIILFSFEKGTSIPHWKVRVWNLKEQLLDFLYGTDGRSAILIPKTEVGEAAHPNVKLLQVYEPKSFLNFASAGTNCDLTVSAAIESNFSAIKHFIESCWEVKSSAPNQPAGGQSSSDINGFCWETKLFPTTADKRKKDEKPRRQTPSGLEFTQELLNFG